MERPLRNVAIIAHVDHGKTTLVDAILAQTGVRSAKDATCVMDSNPLERERGITILAKNCAVDYVPESGHHAGQPVRINILDTPGHADFGGEVERVLRMADGAFLLVDAHEGPMPQTRFVLEKALGLGLRLVVVINKCDRPDADPDRVLNEVFDLLVAMGADDETLDFPVLYASGRDGWAGDSPEDNQRGVVPLLNQVLDRVPAPSCDPEGPLQLLVTNLDWSEYTGRIAVGRIERGVVKPGSDVSICAADGIKKGRVLKALRFAGLGKSEAAMVEAGDLVAIEGIDAIEIGDTICTIGEEEALDRVTVDEPTLHMTFRINDSPFCGREGKYLTSRQIRERLQREMRLNVALRVQDGATPDEFHVSGRGLLHLGVLIENMRREGYEMSVGRPQVVRRESESGFQEPWEQLMLDVSNEGMGSVMELLGNRAAIVQSVDPIADRVRITAEIPARQLIGLRSRMLTATQGEAILQHSFLRWDDAREDTRGRVNGVLVASEPGKVTFHAAEQLCQRGILFHEPGDEVYEGQIVGENARDNDLTVNIVKAKAFSNVRENKDATVVLKASRKMTLEEMLEYCERDELVEVTPESLRLRKKLLKEAERRREARHEEAKKAGASS
ncbi:MAG: translational GTPase TypA [Planctomycetota bacterium]|nr:translational GTPase TypA [Planctomycetota bacterium]